MEFLPDLYRGIVVRSEFPSFPLKRVIEDFDGTILSEQMEKDFLDSRAVIRKELHLKIKGNSMQDNLYSTKTEFLLKDFKWYEEYKNSSNKFVFWEKYKNNYEFLFKSIPYIANVLEILDNEPELSNRYRSHLHDTTHLIYATKSNIFVTHEKRLYKKATELCEFLGIKTKILNYTEFCKLCLI